MLSNIRVYGASIILVLLASSLAFSQQNPNEEKEKQDKEKQAKAQKELREKIEKLLVEKEKDVADCARKSFGESSEKQISIEVVMEIGPGKNINKLSLKPSGEDAKYNNFAQCVEQKLRQINFPDAGSNIVTIKRSYSVKVEKKEAAQ